VERDGQLDRSERSARVSADAGHRFQNVLANLCRHILQLICAQAAQIGGRVNIL
jgi:hypothetical protein